MLRERVVGGMVSGMVGGGAQLWPPVSALSTQGSSLLMGRIAHVTRATAARSEVSLKGVAELTQKECRKDPFDRTAGKADGPVDDPAQVDALSRMAPTQILRRPAPRRRARRAERGPRSRL